MPFQVLVELAMEREQDIPALIYEGRPTVRLPPPHCPPPCSMSAPCMQARACGVMSSAKSCSEGRALLCAEPAAAPGRGG